MKNYHGSELEAYGSGINAAHRIEEYNGNRDPQCPYAEGSKEDAAWWDGFSDGTDDEIYLSQVI